MTHPDDIHDDVFTGDPRRCQRHGCTTSSPDGMHDCPCPKCEAEMEAEDEGGPAPTPIDYSDIPSGRIGSTISGLTASLVIKPSLEHNGTIGLYIFTDVGGNSWPMPVHHGRAIMIGLTYLMSGDSIKEILESNEEEIRAIDAAYLGTRWNGSNHIGKWKEIDEYTTADEAPAEALREALREAATYWTADEYLDPARGDVARGLFNTLAEGGTLSDYAKGEVEAALTSGQALLDQDEVERYLQDLLDEEDTIERCKIDISGVCVDRFEAAIKAGKSVEEATKFTREVLPKDHRNAGLVKDNRFVILCECDENCDNYAAAVVEVMPEHLRASHDAAGNCGVYPANGAKRLVCCEDCANTILDEEFDPRWAHLVES